MSKEKEINKMVKDFPKRIYYEFLEKKYGYLKYGNVLFFDTYELGNGDVIILNEDTNSLCGIYSLGNVYEVEFVFGEYVVVDVIDSPQWFDEKVDEWSNLWWVDSINFSKLMSELKQFM